MKVFKVLAIVTACYIASCSSAAIEVISETTAASLMEAAVVETTKTELKMTTSQPKVETTTRAVEEISEPIEVVDIKPVEPIENKPVEVITDQEIVPIEATLDEVPSNKRKVLYINQQQNGKLNVQLELKDVSVFIVPKHKDPQASLLNLLFKNAQKPIINVENKKPFNGDYSKFTMPVASLEENDRIAPDIESRTPYRVDISSTLGQTPLDIITQPPTYHHLKIMPAIVQSRKLRRSIDTRLHVMDYNTQEQPFNEISDGSDYEETDFADKHAIGDDFVLLGAVENCGPGRRRNSYQICVAVD